MQVYLPDPFLSSGTKQSVTGLLMSTTLFWCFRSDYILIHLRQDGSHRAIRAPAVIRKSSKLPNEIKHLTVLKVFTKWVLFPSKFNRFEEVKILPFPSIFFFFWCWKCSLHAENFSGTAGRMSSLAHSGTQFSTKDRDNDRCTCRCAQLASGGTLTRTLTLSCRTSLPSPRWPIHFPSAPGCRLSLAWIRWVFFSNCLIHLFCRLVVWSVWPVQPQWHLLPQLDQRGALQRHQVVLLEGPQSDGDHDDHDGAPSQFPGAWYQMRHRYLR